jgi:UDP-4-amino-4,6-dideoxy-N-acetyl-beta-L-altrosamine transaminase
MKDIPYGKQNITDEDLKAVSGALVSELITQGPRVAAFEKAFAKYIGSKYAVALSNGTVALHLCAEALEINEHTNVITTPITFVASANCVRYCGGNVFFADIDPLTYTLDLKKVEELILSKPKGFFQGIIPVDFAGYPVNLEAFKKLAVEHGLWIIEDACHAPGGFFLDSNKQQQNCGNGNFADLSIFSFHPVKHIACGEGGMVTTNDEKLYKRILNLRTHGITRDAELMNENHGLWYYEMQELGFNYRLTDFQAALGISQLSRADEGIKRRRAIAATYFEAFKNEPTILGQSGSILGHAYHLYIIRTAKRKELYDFLRTQHIYCQVHYIPVHFMPYYQNLGSKKGDFPVAEKYYDECLSLPMYPTLTIEEQAYIIDTVKNFLQ